MLGRKLYFQHAKTKQNPVSKWNTLKCLNLVLCIWLGWVCTLLVIPQTPRPLQYCHKKLRGRGSDSWFFISLVKLRICQNFWCHPYYVFALSIYIYLVTAYLLKGTSGGPRCSIPKPVKAYNFWSHVLGISLNLYIFQENHNMYACRWIQCKITR